MQEQEPVCTSTATLAELRRREERRGVRWIGRLWNAGRQFSKLQVTGGFRAPGEPVTTLRGASVNVDIRRVTHLVVGACLMALAAAVIILFVAGVQKNAQITRLHKQGVAVKVTVSGCIGLMGGSGSNIAGYDCTGAFTLAGHTL